MCNRNLEDVCIWLSGNLDERELSLDKSNKLDFFAQEKFFRNWRNNFGFNFLVVAKSDNFGHL